MTHANHMDGGPKSVPLAIVAVIAGYVVALVMGLPQLGTQRVVEAEAHRAAAADGGMEDATAPTAAPAIIAPPLWTVGPFVLLLAAMAFQLQLLESANYWDYLLDPIYSLVSIGWVAGRLATSTRVSLTNRYSKTLPRNISTI